MSPTPRQPLPAVSALADALWTCMQARREESEARASADVPDSWDYFGHSYFEAIDRADLALEDALAGAVNALRAVIDLA